MRLNATEVKHIKEQARYYFGEEVKVYLFGSRTDDTKKGGDIDLFIQNTKETAVRSKIQFISSLILRIGEQKIDVVIDRTDLRKTMFYNSIKRNAILL